MGCFLCGAADAVIICDDEAACEDRCVSWQPTGLLPALGGDGVSPEELEGIKRGILRLVPPGA